MELKKDKNGYICIEVKKLIDWNEPNGEGCLVSDKITKEGYKVGYMYREQPDDDKPDSGWRFMAGNEDDEYINNADNVHIFAINTVCNYDSDIIPYLNSEIGSRFIRINSNKFEIDNGSKPIFIEKQFKNRSDLIMEEKVIRMIIYYVLASYDDDKKTIESCIEVNKLLIAMVKNEETKADRLLNSFPAQHPVLELYKDIRNSEEFLSALETSKEKFEKADINSECLKNIEDDAEVEELSNKLAK